jgi:hypothetical protein
MQVVSVTIFAKTTLPKSLSSSMALGQGESPPTAKIQYRKFETNIPRKGIAQALNPNIHIHVSVSVLYIPTTGLPFLLQENMWTDRGNI